MVGLLQTIPSAFVGPVQWLHLTKRHRLNLFHHLPNGNRNTLLLLQGLEMFVSLLPQHLASIVAQSAVILLTIFFKTHQEIQARFRRSLRLRFKLFQLLPTLVLELQHRHPFVKSSVLEVSADTIRTITIDVITAGHLQSSQIGSNRVRKRVLIRFAKGSLCPLIERYIINQSRAKKK